MKKFPFIFFICIICLAKSLYAQTPNWSENVASILYDHCVQCHRPGEIAPFSLLTYSDAFEHAGNISVQVDARNMPPWPADENYCNYLDENILSQNEIDIIDDWVNEGAPCGDTLLSPDPPVFPEGSQLGTPDTVLSFAGHFTHPGDGIDHYWGIVLPSGFLTEHHIAAFEFRPGNKSLVHHVLMYYDTTGWPAVYDNFTPEYGFEAVSSVAFQHSVFMTLYNPGMKPRVLPSGTAFRVPAGADIVLQVHYAPLDYIATDSSSINVFYSDDDTDRLVTTRFIGEGKITEPEFMIPANEVKTFHSQYTINGGDISLIGVSPHMHLLGKSYKLYAVNPSGDTIPLINIPDWKFNWQLLYNFTSLQKLEDGTVVYGEISYDNTTNNPSNPHNPPVDVGFGYDTDEEMCRYYLNTVPYEDGDEAMILDSSDVATSTDGQDLVQTPQLYPLSPDPATNGVEVSFYLPNEQQVSLSIFDMNGKLISHPWENKNCDAGFHKAHLNISELPSGIYLCTITMNNFVRTKPFVVK